MTRHMLPKKLNTKKALQGQQEQSTRVDEEPQGQPPSRQTTSQR